MLLRIREFGPPFREAPDSEMTIDITRGDPGTVRGKGQSIEYASFANMMMLFTDEAQVRGVPEDGGSLLADGGHSCPVGREQNVLQDFRASP